MAFSKVRRNRFRLRVSFTNPPRLLLRPIPFGEALRLDLIVSDIGQVSGTPAMFVTIADEDSDTVVLQSLPGEIAQVDDTFSVDIPASRLSDLEEGSTYAIEVWLNEAASGLARLARGNLTLDASLEPEMGPPSVPDNVLTFNGDPLTFDGDYLTFTAA